jgi:hypothetical protein
MQCMQINDNEDLSKLDRRLTPVLIEPANQLALYDCKYKLGFITCSYLEKTRSPYFRALNNEY